MSTSRRVHATASALCAAAGLVVVVAALARGSVIDIVVGTAVLAVALVAMLATRALDHLARELSATNSQLDDLRLQVERLEQAIGAAAPTSDEIASTSPRDADAVLNLAASPTDPSSITAATLNRSRFPRLAAMMSDDPPPADTPRDTADDATVPQDEDPMAAFGAAMPPERANLLASVASRNLIQTWAAAMRNADVKTCRSVLSVMLDTAREETVDRMRRELSTLEDRIEGVLRRRFADCVADRDINGVLQIGAEICNLLPDRPVADEYRRLAPLLARAQAEHVGSVTTPVQAQQVGETGRDSLTARL